MPTNPAAVASARLLSLLSLLQRPREWSGAALAERLGVTPRTVRRDVERLRELGYRVHTVRGPDGGYRLDASAQVPPLLFDDEQVVALALALRGAALLGAGIEEPAARALSTIRRVMPSRLAARLDVLDAAAAAPVLDGSPPADPAVLVGVGTAIRRSEELRFDYRVPGRDDDPPVAARRAQPHHLLARSGRWYVVAWEPVLGEWRTFRADRMTLRVPGGPRFTPRVVPGGDAAAFLAGRFRGAEGAGGWPCTGEVVLGCPAADVVPFARDGTVEPVGDDRCRLRMGAWSWPGLAALVARFDADVEVVDPPELRQAFGRLADRARRASAESCR